MHRSTYYMLLSGRVCLISRKLVIRGDSQYRYGHAYIRTAHCNKVDDGYIRQLDVQTASAPMWVAAWHEILIMFC
jgi:hypothetical protein